MHWQSSLSLHKRSNTTTGATMVANHKRGSTSFSPSPLSASASPLLPATNSRGRRGSSFSLHRRASTTGAIDLHKISPSSSPPPESDRTGPKRWHSFWGLHKRSSTKEMDAMMGPSSFTSARTKDHTERRTKRTSSPSRSRRYFSSSSNRRSRATGMGEHEQNHSSLFISKRSKRRRSPSPMPTTTSRRRSIRGTNGTASPGFAMVGAFQAMKLMNKDYHDTTTATTVEEETRPFPPPRRHSLKILRRGRGQKVYLMAHRSVLV